MGIAVTHVAATQVARYCVVDANVPPFFSMWFSTGWNVFLVPPHWWHRWLREGTTSGSAGRMRPARLVRLVGPFYVLWAGANTLYVTSLKSISSSLTTALFGVTPAMVVLLAVPVLGRHLTLISCLACALAASGVALIAQPWRRSEASAPLLGLGSALGAAACAASYKVLFKRVFDDAPPRFVLQMLAVLGAWSLTLGTALLGLSAAAAPGGAAGALAALPSLPWGMLCAKSVLDLAFNFLIAFGIALTHPLFISIGTIVGTPLNVGVEWVLRGTVPAAAQAGGIAVILLAFALLLGEEVQRQPAPPTAAGRGEPPASPGDAEVCGGGGPPRRWARLDESSASGGGGGTDRGADATSTTAACDASSPKRDASEPGRGPGEERT